jgi:hypothetical protein
MKLADIVSEKLLDLGVEKPSVRLVDEVERLVVNKVRKVVGSMVTPRLAARAFAATLGPVKGGSGDAPAGP